MISSSAGWTADRADTATPRLFLKKGKPGCCWLSGYNKAITYHPAHTVTLLRPNRRISKVSSFLLLCIDAKLFLNHKWEPLPNLQILFLVLFLFRFNFRFFSSAPAFLFCFRFHIPNIINDNLLIRVQGSIQGMYVFSLACFVRARISSSNSSAHACSSFSVRMLSCNAASFSERTFFFSMSGSISHRKSTG